MTEKRMCKDVHILFECAETLLKNMRQCKIHVKIVNFTYSLLQKMKVSGTNVSAVLKLNKKYVKFTTRN